MISILYYLCIHNYAIIVLEKGAMCYATYYAY